MCTLYEYLCKKYSGEEKLYFHHSYYALGMSKKSSITEEGKSNANVLIYPLFLGMLFVLMTNEH